MKNIAIITEYNPFHKGHAIQLEKIRELYGDSRIIAIMSGNTVQRGEAALYDKYLRGEAAVRHGVSAVFEMPFPYSCSCAEIFAAAGIHIAECLGNIDALVFGSECGDIDTLKNLSKNLRSKEYQKAFEEYSRENKKMPYPERREAVYEDLYGRGSFSIGSNDILGIEYISALERSGSDICPVTYKREAGYTAAETRHSVRSGEAAGGLDEISLSVFENKPHTDVLKAGELMLQGLKRELKKSADEIFDMPEDLWSKMKSAALSCCDYRDFVIKMKRSGYTDARFRRELMYLWCGVDAVDKTPAYTTLIGTDDKGREYLGQIRKTKKIEILTKPADYTKMSEAAQKQFEKGMIAECLFAYALTKPMSYGEMIRKGPFIKKD